MFFFPSILYLAISVITIPFAARHLANTQVGSEWRSDGTVGLFEFLSAIVWGLFWPVALLYVLSTLTPTKKARAQQED